MTVAILWISVVECGSLRQIKITAASAHQSSDNIFTNEVINNITPGIIINDISDHLPVFAICKNNDNLNSISKKMIMKRKINDETLIELQSKLESTDWSPVMNNTTRNVDECYDKFLEKFLNVYDYCCPYQRLSVKPVNPKKPWFTPSLKRACNKKNQLYKKIPTAKK